MPRTMRTDRVTLRTLNDMRAKGERIVMLTAYDFPTAKLADEAGVDVILVGDSLGQVCLGYDDTTRVTLEEMLHHTKAVVRACPRALVVTDMPLGSYGVERARTVENALRLVKEGGADAVKLEGAAFATEVSAITAVGIPVVGHLGFTPQSIHLFGGFKVAGKVCAEADLLLENAVMLEEAGISLLVLECVPSALAREISRAVRIPVIGIGAGPDVSGQVLVFHDLLGFYDTSFRPRFLKRYDSLKERMIRAISSYVSEVRDGCFPGPEHCYDGDRSPRRVKRHSDKACLGGTNHTGPG